MVVVVFSWYDSEYVGCSLYDLVRKSDVGEEGISGGYSLGCIWMQWWGVCVAICLV